MSNQQLPAKSQPQAIVPSRLIQTMSAEWAKVLPKCCSPERFARVALSCINKNPMLSAALQTPQGQTSLLSAFMTCAEFGLEPNGRHAHLVPYKDNRNGGYQITLIFDYKGIVELARRSGQIKRIYASEVCENDIFEFNKGEICKHSINFLKPRGQTYAYYAEVTFNDGSVQCEVMSKEEVDKIRSRSKSANNGPWVTDYTEMAKKGLACDTPIFTLVGWKTMGDIKVGDYVFDKDGIATPVIAVSEVKHLPCFRLTFSNGEQIICDNEHRWVCGIGSNASTSMKTYDIAEMYSAFENGKPISVPVAKAINTTNQSAVFVEFAYLLGYWIGNGTSRGASITCNDDDVDEIVRHIQFSPFKLGKIRKYSQSNADCIGIKDGFKNSLRNYNLLQNKHMPEAVMNWGITEKIAFVRGLMDSDGCIEKERGRAIFTTTDKKLAEDFYSLIHSLGEIAHIKGRKQKGFGKEVTCYCVEWKPYTFIPVTLQRKEKNIKQRKQKAYRSIKKIEKIESVPTRCIAVGSESKTYLAGKTFVPTHNTVFKRLSKWLPLSPEVKEAIDRDNDNEFGDIREFIAEQRQVNSRFNMVGGSEALSLTAALTQQDNKQEDDIPYDNNTDAETVHDAKFTPEAASETSGHASPLAKALLAAKAPITVSEVMEFCKATGTMFAPDIMSQDINGLVQSVLNWQDSGQNQ